MPGSPEWLRDALDRVLTSAAAEIKACLDEATQLRSCTISSAPGIQGFGANSNSNTSVNVNELQTTIMRAGKALASVLNELRQVAPPAPEISFGPSADVSYAPVAAGIDKIVANWDDTGAASCPKGHVMEAVSYGAGNYSRGWWCDKCNMQGNAIHELRWVCRECVFDCCLRCQPCNFRQTAV